MNARQSVRLSVALLLVSAFAHVTFGGPPNVVFIFADDWGWGELSCHGSAYFRTPNIDRLAKEGIDFQRFAAAIP